jgi:hypothetical protein
MTRSELIAALGSASGPSRELDAEIAKLVGAPHGPYEHVTVETRSIEYCEEQAPAYTGSMDAAMTLVPSTWQWHCGTCNEDDMPWATLTDTDTWVDYGAEAATPALALCIACIKALENGE